MSVGHQRQSRAASKRHTLRRATSAPALVARSASPSALSPRTKPIGASAQGLERNVESRLGSLGSGTPLSQAARSYFEPRFGADLSHVRLHSGPGVSGLASALGARAFARGADVVFGRDEYSPDTPQGRQLLAHELAHVVQHDRAPRGSPILYRVPVTQQEIADSRRTPGGVAVLRSARGVSLYNFGIGSAALKNEHLQVLQEVARLHTRYGVELHFGGHTDATDTEELNLRLSIDRVSAVVDALLPRGVHSATTSFHGEDEPVGSNATVDGRSRNRRVDITFRFSPSRRPPVPPPQRTDEPGPSGGGGGGDGGDGPDGDSWFCAEHPILCVLFGVGVGGLIYCILNPLSCLPLGGTPGVPGPGTPDPEPTRPEDLPCGHPRMPLTHVDLQGAGAKGEHVVADPLTRCPGNTVGSTPLSRPDWPTGWECVVAANETTRWVRAHLLHGPSSAGSSDHLHGPGNLRSNIIISDKSINGNMYTQAEGDAVNRVRSQHQILRYEVRVNHFSGPYPRPFFAESVRIDYGVKHPVTGAVTPIFGDTIRSRFAHQPPPCPPTPAPPPAPQVAGTPPASAGPTIGPAVPGATRVPLTGLCHDRRITCAAFEEITRFTFPDRQRAVALEAAALDAYCRPAFGGAERHDRFVHIQWLAERRVDDYIATWRDLHVTRPVLGPCP